MKCGYCETANVPRGNPLADVAAKALGALRILMEMRADGATMMDIMTAFQTGKIPIATESDRVCPYCRRGVVTRQAKESLYLDLLARAFGLSRAWTHLRAQEDFGLQSIIRWIVEGDAVLQDEPVIEVVQTSESPDETEFKFFQEG